jgi:hypothetical protein
MIESAFKRGGMNPDAATEAASAIANCAAALTHRGPMTLDYTPQKFRFISPERRKYSFPSLDNLPQSPDYRPPISEEPFYPGPPIEPQSPRPDFGPSQEPPVVPVAGGTYVNLQIANFNFTTNTFTVRGVPYRVVKDIAYRNNRLEVEYVDLNVLAATPVKRRKPIDFGAYGRFLSDIRLDTAALKLYGDIYEAKMLTPPVKVDAVNIPLTNCE